jgi:hypothetical protein
MSVQKRKELIEIIVNYNKQQDENKRKLTMPSSYKVEILKEQVDKNIEAERLTTVDKMTSFNTGLSDSISATYKQKIKLKFPNKFGATDYHAKALGEAQAHRGQSFISSNDNNSELILKELANAKANNETDYFSTMLDYILMNVPPPKEQVKLTEKKKNFYNSTKELSEVFKKEFGIDVLEKSVDELKEIHAGAEGFLMALQSGAEKYLTKDMMLGMTKQDRINNIDIINNSAQFWTEL